MKNLLTSIFTICALTTFGQQLSLSEWNEQAKTNIRLLPKYGHIPKTEGQKSSDREFIETTLKQFSSNRKASDHLIELGFKYLYNDVKTAMYRFNQAYLLDTTNTDIYWGYAAVYMVLGDLTNAQIQYLNGIAIEPKNTHLLTDYGTYFMTQYYGLQPVDEKNALSNLDSAVTYMTRSYGLDKMDQNTAFKLAICYYQKADCKNALRFYEECKQLGGQPITEEFTDALNELCKKNK